ncbi:transmembrane protein 154 isoform X1 [Eleutherodactylus coqui]|uniref:transmembrane protein 154 isoform X1 n=2 Tax=Eleutherodactylus coqui TaxID=57060 RepID=UPI003461A3BF
MMTTNEDLTPTSQTYLVSITPEDETSPSVTLDAFNATSSDITESPDVPGTDLVTIIIYAAPAIILVLLVVIIIVIVKRKRHKKKQEDMPVDDDVQSPIFEEDTPSVMEIEIDDLDKWMNNMKNSCRLSTLEEENKVCTSAET